MERYESGSRRNRNKSGSECGRGLDTAKIETNPDQNVLRLTDSLAQEEYVSLDFEHEAL